MAYVPISKELHGDKRWVRHSSMLFAKADTVAPLLVSDLAAAVHALPIAFVEYEQQFVLVSVMGLRPEENLLISPQGEWLSEYMPALYRSSPFALLPAQDHHVLAIDESCISNAQGSEPFFNSDGEITESIKDAFERVQRINASRQMTQLICAALSENNLIKRWPITLNDGVNKQEVAGIYCIDEEALNALDDASFLSLRQTNALPVAYAQLYSMQKVSLLARLAEQRPVVTNEASANDTFSFAGL